MSRRMEMQLVEPNLLRPRLLEQLVLRRDLRQATVVTEPPKLRRRSSLWHLEVPSTNCRRRTAFIMGLLRNWRLLQAAGLTAEEKRDILSTTKNSLEYETAASALQRLWDELRLGHREHSGTP